MNLKEYQKLGEKIDEKVFVGCNLKAFSNTAKIPFNLALNNGLTESSKVLEIGCGCCRVGYWFIDYLNSGCYYGIEPNIEMLDVGKEILLPELLESKLPSFDNNEKFNLSVFDTEFDMFIAFSIWSHASKQQIETVVKQFKNYKPFTFLGTIVLPTNRKEDYIGDEWVGYSHKSDVRGNVAHDVKWLENLCEENNCKFSIIDKITVHQQWIKITNI